MCNSSRVSCSLRSPPDELYHPNVCPRNRGPTHSGPGFGAHQLCCALHSSLQPPCAPTLLRIPLQPPVSVRTNSAAHARQSLRAFRARVRCAPTLLRMRDKVCAHSGPGFGAHQLCCAFHSSLQSPCAPTLLRMRDKIRAHLALVASLAILPARRGPAWPPAGGAR